jgi:sugar lactone lactonase YvrE
MTHMAIDPLSGNLILCDNNRNRILILNEEGEFIRSFGRAGREEGMIHRPEMVAVTNDHKIIVCDDSGHRIQIFDEHGNHLRSIGSDRDQFHGMGMGMGPERGTFRRIGGLAVDSKNRIIVSDSTNNNIHILDDEGNFVQTFTKSNPEREHVRLSQVVVDRFDNILVTDYHTGTVFAFSPEGRFINSIEFVLSEPGSRTFNLTVDLNNSVLISVATQPPVILSIGN